MLSALPATHHRALRGVFRRAHLQPNAEERVAAAAARVERMARRCAAGVAREERLQGLHLVCDGNLCQAAHLRARRDSKGAL